MSWSYSKVSKYETCPFMFHQQYVLGNWSEMNEHAKRGIEMHKQLEDKLPRSAEDGLHPETPEWMRPHVPYLLDYGAADREATFYITDQWTPNSPFEHGRYWVMAKMDLAQQRATDAVVIDYKSGKRREAHQDQLELYAAIVLSARPELKRVEAKAYYLDEKPGGWGPPVYVTKDNVDRIREDWARRVAKMESDTEFAPRPNWLCRYCEFAADKGGPCQFSSNGGG